MECEECKPLARWLAVELAATLFGNKPSTIVCIRDLKYSPLLTLWRRYGEKLFCRTPIQTWVLRQSRDTEIVLFYREDLLKKCFRRRSYSEFLRRRGYPVEQGISAILKNLHIRFVHGCPHEIGVILGIPLKDVVGFMEVRCPAVQNGQWKIYGCCESSLRLMRCFEKDRVLMERLVEASIKPWQVFRYEHSDLLKLRSAALPA